ncbi:hypothetical protein [Modicisalibacter luteus]|nr:hypothetical protein [Halomonas lutea]
MTRTYEGRVPAKAVLENGALWVPIEHHIAGVFENGETSTKITFAQAEGALAETTLSLAEEYRELLKQADRPPKPEDHFTLHELSPPPTTLEAPIERGEWQFYWHGNELITSPIPSASAPRQTFYRLLPRFDEMTLQDALDRFERDVVNHGHLRIRVKEINIKIRDNVKAIKNDILVHAENGS